MVSRRIFERPSYSDAAKKRYPRRPPRPRRAPRKDPRQKGRRDANQNGIRRTSAAGASGSPQVRRYRSLDHLDLGWCALDPASVKELTKARNLASLDLSGTLAPDGADAGDYARELGGLITHAHGLTKLSLKHCPLGPEGSAAVAAALSTNRTLVKLDLSDCNLGDADVDALAAGLQRNDVLLDLALDGNEFSGGAALAGSPSLRTLSLRNLPRATTFTARSLGAALRSNDRLKTLRLSTFAQIHVQDLRTTTSVQLANHELSSRDFAVVAALLETNRNVTALDVSGNDTGSSWADDVTGLLKASSVVHSLQSVRVDKLSIDVRKITLGETVKFARAGLASVGAFATAALLRHNAHVKEVDLSNNGLQSAAVVALCEALRGKPTLSSLNVAGNSFDPTRHAPLFAATGDDGAPTPLSNEFAGNVTSLAVVDAWAIQADDASFSAPGESRFDDRQMQLVCGVLAAHGCLRRLSLNGAQLTERGGKDLVVALRRNRTLETLDLRESMGDPKEDHRSKDETDDLSSPRTAAYRRAFYDFALELGSVLSKHPKMASLFLLPLWPARGDKAKYREDRPCLQVRYLKTARKVACGAREHAIHGTDVLDEPTLRPVEVAVIARLLKANRRLSHLEVRGLGVNEVAPGSSRGPGTNDALFDVVEAHAGRLEAFTVVNSEPWRADKIIKVVASPRLRCLELKNCGLTAPVAVTLFKTLKVLEASGGAAPLEVVSLDQNDLDDAASESRSRRPAVGDRVFVKVAPEAVEVTNAALRLTAARRCFDDGDDAGGPVAVVIGGAGDGVRAKRLLEEAKLLEGATWAADGAAWVLTKPGKPATEAVARALAALPGVFVGLRHGQAVAAAAVPCNRRRADDSFVVARSRRRRGRRVDQLSRGRRPRTPRMHRPILQEDDARVRQG